MPLLAFRHSTRQAAESNQMQGATPSNKLNGLSPFPLLLIPALGASASVLHCHLSKQSCPGVPQLGPLSDASKLIFTQTIASAVRR